MPLTLTKVGVGTSEGDDTGDKARVAFQAINTTMDATKVICDANETTANAAAVSGGAEHDGFSDFVANEHIDWTNATNALVTTGAGTFGGAVYSGNATLTTQNTFYLSAGDNVSPIIVFDANDWIGYNRTNNDWNWYIGGVSEFALSATTADFKSNAITTTGTGTFGDNVFFLNGTLTTQNTFNAGAISATTPYIGWDSNDRIAYDRTTNQFDFVIGAANQLTLNATTADFQNNLVKTTGNVQVAGIDFGTTETAAEILDDYEEGTWTAIFSDLTNDATIASQYSYYTKVGRLVTINTRIQLSSKGSVSGTVYIEGLPYTAKTSSGSTSAMLVTAPSGLTLPVDGVTGIPAAVHALVVQSQSYMVLVNFDASTGYTVFTDTDFGASTDIIICGSYEV